MQNNRAKLSPACSNANRLPGAYYEYICRRAGIGVHYCAEQFDNDGSPVATIVKGVKRAMAGEYSRELWGKVFAGQCRLIELGFRQGGAPGFGLRRMLLDQTGGTKGTLAHGEQKSIQTDRVVSAVVTSKPAIGSAALRA